MELLEEIKDLNVTCDEIRSFGECFAGFSSVSYSESEVFLGPTLHDTQATKEYGPPHINIGCGGFLLILDNESALVFVDYVRDLRTRKSL